MSTLYQESSVSEKLSDVAAEKAVLAGLCQYGQNAKIDVEDIINNDSFTVEANKLLYKCFETALQSTDRLDLPTILATANKLGLYDIITEREGINYLNTLFSFSIEQENIRLHAKRIAKLEITRKLQSQVRHIYTRLGDITGNEGLGEILSIAEKPILDFANSINNKEELPVLLGDTLAEYVEHLRNNQNKSVGISSGWSRYDAYIGGGFRRKTVSLFGARMKVGKSVLADNIAIHVAHRLKIPVLMLDTEMSLADHQNRILAYFTKIPINNIESGKFAGNPILEEKINRAVNIMGGMPYTYKNIAGKPFEEVLSIIHRWLMKTVGVDENGRTNDCLVVYDYFKLMNADQLKAMQEFQVLGFQISELHNFCVRYDFPVVSFVQLNRDGITKDTTDVVSQSDRLLWLCTNFTIFKAKSDNEIQEDGEEFGNRKLIPLIARHGPAIEEGNYINMFMQGQYAMVEELRTKADIIKQADDGTFEVEAEEAPFD